MASSTFCISTSLPLVRSARTTMAPRRAVQAKAPKLQMRRSVAVRAMADEEPTVVKAEPTAVPSPEVDTAPISSQASIDPADGSIAYGAALGDSDIVGNAMSIFKGGMASEILNGRAAMVGFTAALVVELTSGESLFAQMFNLRDVGVRVLWLPKLGFFLIPAVVILVILSSFAPKARGVEQNGLNVEAKPSWGIFTPSSERTNGRAAMIGLVALAATESIFGHALF